MCRIDPSSTHSAVPTLRPLKTVETLIHRGMLEEEFQQVILATSVPVYSAFHTHYIFSDGRITIDSNGFIDGKLQSWRTVQYSQGDQSTPPDPDD